MKNDLLSHFAIKHYTPISPIYTRAGRVPALSALPPGEAPATHMLQTAAPRRNQGVFGHEKTPYLRRKNKN